MLQYPPATEQLVDAYSNLKQIEYIDRYIEIA